MTQTAPPGRSATRRDRALFEELSRERPTGTPHGRALVIAAVAMGLVRFALLGWGAWLLWTGTWRLAPVPLRAQRRLLE